MALVEGSAVLAGTPSGTSAALQLSYASCSASAAAAAAASGDRMWLGGAFFGESGSLLSPDASIARMLAADAPCSSAVGGSLPVEHPLAGRSDCLSASEDPLLPVDHPLAAEAGCFSELPDVLLPVDRRLWAELYPWSQTDDPPLLGSVPLKAAAQGAASTDASAAYADGLRPLQTVSGGSSASSAAASCEKALWTECRCSCAPSALLSMPSLTLAGAADGSSSASASQGRVIPVSADSSGASSVSVPSLGQMQKMPAAADGSCSVSASAFYLHKMQGEAGGRSSVLPLLTIPAAALSGGALCPCSASATLDCGLLPAAASSGLSGGGFPLSVLRPCASASGGASSASAVPTVRKRLKMPTSGDSMGVCYATADAGIAAALSSPAQGRAEVSAAVSKDAACSSSCAGGSAAACTLSCAYASVEGACSGSSSAASQGMRFAAALEAASASASQVSAAGMDVSSVAMTAAASGAASAGAALSMTVCRLAAICPCSSAVQASFPAEEHGLSVSVSSLTLISSSLTGAFLLIPALEGSAQCSGLLRLPVTLEGRADGNSSTSALSGSLPRLAATSGGGSAPSASLTLPQQGMAGDAACSSSLDALLAGGDVLSASCACSASASGALTALSACSASSGGGCSAGAFLLQDALLAADCAGAGAGQAPSLRSLLAPLSPGPAQGASSVAALLRVPALLGGAAAGSSFLVSGMAGGIAGSAAASAGVSAVQGHALCERPLSAQLAGAAAVPGAALSALRPAQGASQGGAAAGAALGVSALMEVLAESGGAAEAEAPALLMRLSASVPAEGGAEGGMLLESAGLAGAAAGRSALSAALDRAAAGAAAGACAAEALLGVLAALDALAQCGADCDGWLLCQSVASSASGSSAVAALLALEARFDDRKSAAMEVRVRARMPEVRVPGRMPEVRVAPPEAVPKADAWRRSPARVED